MKLINKKENQITFTIKSEESLLNAIRRYVNQIFILAIDEVEIAKNDSALYDETIAHRFGLIPLKMSKTDNEKTTYELKLESKKEGAVYSKEITGKIKVVYDNIPITVLNKNQELEVTATVRAGKGSEHSRFSPGIIFYRNIAEIKIDKDCPEEIANVCPQKVLGIKDGRIIVEDGFRCDMCELCVEECIKRGKESIKINSSDELAVTVESFGQIETEEIFKRAIEVLKKDLKEVEKKFGK